MKKKLHDGKAREEGSNILVWQWGRRGAGPKIAIELTKSLKKVAKNSQIFLSLSDRAEILSNCSINPVDLSIKTYSTVGGYVLRLLTAPLIIFSLYRQIRLMKINLAICTMPGLLDMLMVFTLKRLKIPYAVIIHDAYPHPGERYFCQHYLQKHLVKHADLIIAFSEYVYNELQSRHLIDSSRLVMAWHPPFEYELCSEKEVSNKKGNAVHLLNFGRLLPYKGFNLLDRALDLVISDQPFLFRIVGQGPKSRILDQLNNRSNVIVENRWVPEEEIISLIKWADAIILPYEEASQSGVLAIALAFNKPALVTRVGGLTEQGKEKEFVFLCDPNPDDIAKGIEKILNLNFPLDYHETNVAEEWEKMASHLLEQVNEKLLITV